MTGRCLELKTPADTRALGQALAACLPGGGAPLPALLLYGPLGAGKTALTQALVRALPGGAAAEVASPSFTLYNLYPSDPAVIHFDLYRLETGRPGAEYHEWRDDLEAGRPGLMVVEWPDRLGPRDLPGERLCLWLDFAACGRSARLEATGAAARDWLAAVFLRLDQPGPAA